MIFQDRAQLLRTGLGQLRNWPIKEPTGRRMPWISQSWACIGGRACIVTRRTRGMAEKLIPSVKSKGGHKGWNWKMSHTVEAKRSKSKMDSVWGTVVQNQGFERPVCATGAQDVVWGWACCRRGDHAGLNTAHPPNQPVGYLWERHTL